MPNWLEKHVGKVLAKHSIREEDIVDVWYSKRNPKRVVFTIAGTEGRHASSAKRLSIAIPQQRG